MRVFPGPGGTIPRRSLPPLHALWRGSVVRWNDFACRMPEDVRDEEVTVIVLFRLSVAFNCALGGAPKMTFSARCHESRLTSRHFAQRIGWHGLSLMIDFACATTRGETAHCECAWLNHRARGR